MDDKDAPEARRADEAPTLAKIFSILAGAIGGVLVQLFIVSTFDGIKIPSNVQEIISGLLYTPAIMPPIICATLRAFIGGWAGYFIHLRLRNVKAIYVIIAAFFAGFLLTGVVAFCADFSLVQ